ncbi:type II secretion system minor pseudopilin GspH [Thiorhodospira sibirica]|uniref:type II secretion system minor pseudopilin GspH n=1 Tax=Thiorhodospira sibirica TaxID=154347 RepID=UPI00131EFFC4|nr:type II secretion system minor pseudopilin GspH [Thiorhodospira sibirica]
MSCDIRICPLRPGRSAHGFTLLEILVVLVLVAIMAGFAVISLGDGSRDRTIEQEGRRLVALLNLLRDEAILGGEVRAVGFAPQAYHFLRLYRVDERSYEWLPDEDDPVLRSRDLAPLGVDFLLYLDNLPQALNPRLRHPPPQIFFSDTGEMMPFALHLRDERERRVLWILEGHADGRFALMRAADGLR